LSHASVLRGLWAPRCSFGFGLSFDPATIGEARSNGSRRVRSPTEQEIRPGFGRRPTQKDDCVVAEVSTPLENSHSVPLLRRRLLFDTATV